MKINITKQRLQELAAIETPVNEKINFMLGPSIGGDPNKPMKDSFKIIFKDVRKALETVSKVNQDLKSRGLKPIEWIFGGKGHYDRLEVIFTKPSNQQMQFILNAFNDSDIESIGRVL